MASSSSRSMPVSSQICRADTYTPSSPTTRPAGINIGANSDRMCSTVKPSPSSHSISSARSAPCHPFETVEQSRSLDSFHIDVVGHRLNVYLLS